MDIISRPSSGLHRSNENLSRTGSKSTEPTSHRPRASTLPKEMLKRLREGKAMAKKGYESPKEDTKPVSSTHRTRPRRDSISELQNDVFADDYDYSYHERRRRSATFSGDGTRTPRQGSAVKSSHTHCASPSPNGHLDAHTMGHYRERARTMSADVKRRLMLQFGRPPSPETPRTPSPSRSSPVSSPTPSKESVRKESATQSCIDKDGHDKDRHQTDVDGLVDNCSTLIDACLFMASDEAGAVHRDPLPKGSNAFAQVMEELDPNKPEDIGKKVKKSQDKTKCPKKQARPVKKRPQRHSSVIPPRQCDLVRQESQEKSSGSSSAPNSPPTGRHIHWSKTVTFNNS